VFVGAFQNQEGDSLYESSGPCARWVECVLRLMVRSISLSLIPFGGLVGIQEPVYSVGSGSLLSEIIISF
jgi:hypothetical protein